MQVAFEDSSATGHLTLDVRHVVVRHTDEVVLIRVVTQALTRPRGDETFMLYGLVKVDQPAQPSESDAWYWSVSFDERHRRQGTGMWVVDAAYGEQFGCSNTDKGPRATAHYDGNWVAVTIPRRCLALDGTNARPRWVQVSVNTSHSLGLTGPATSTTLVRKCWAPGLHTSRHGSTRQAGQRDRFGRPALEGKQMGCRPRRT